MRTFTLINGNGIEYSITERGCLFHDISGLGYSREETYRLVGDRRILVSREMSTDPVTGAIAFYGEKPYEQYYDFYVFSCVEPLTLIYNSYGIDYKRRVSITSIEKSELNNADFLDCTINFTPLTPWYRTISVITIPSGSTGEGTLWPPKSDEEDGSVSDPDFWPFKWISANNMSVVINSDSYKDSPTKLTIYGPISDPSWEHFVNGQPYSTGKLSGVSVGEGQNLVISCNDDSYYIKIFNNDSFEEVADVYQKSDFTTDRFIMLKNGRNQIHVISQSATPVTIKMEADLYYDTM